MKIIKNNSFTIKCNNCGHEFEFKSYPLDCWSDKDISISEFEGEIEIYCDCCENKISNI